MAFANLLVLPIYFCYWCCAYYTKPLLKKHNNAHKPAELARMHVLCLLYCNVPVVQNLLVDSKCKILAVQYRSLIVPV